MDYVKIKAGLDWTGSPSLKEPHPYGPGIVENISDLESEFEKIKKN